MTELVLGVGPHHTEGLTVGADGSQCTRTEGLSRFVQVRRYENGVKPKAGLALNFRGDGPFANPFPWLLLGTGYATRNLGPNC